MQVHPSRCDRTDRTDTVGSCQVAPKVLGAGVGLALSLALKRFAVKLVAVSAAVIGLALITIPTEAQSAGDTTSPQLQAPIKASFTVGAQITADNYFCGDDFGVNFISAPENFKWTGSDNSGSVRYSLLIDHGGWLEPAFEDSTQTSYTVPGGGTNWSNACGGGFEPLEGWRLTASDPSGNNVTRNITGYLITVTQEDGTRSNGETNYAIQPTISYAGTWRTSNFVDYSQKATRSTTAAGASVTATMTVPTGKVSHIGLVMPEGPTRGSAKVYIDGTLKATVSTYAASAHSRVIVFERSIRAGTHRIKVVNMATPGHPRIDLDAVLTN